MKLTPITQHLVHSFAIRNGRSDASALAELIQSGYNQWMSAWSDRVSAPPPSEAETIAEKVEGGRGLTVFLPNAVIAELQATARAERRSVSSLVKVIVGEGIAKRRIAGVNTKIA